MFTPLSILRSRINRSEGGHASTPAHGCTHMAELKTNTFGDMAVLSPDGRTLLTNYAEISKRSLQLRSKFLFKKSSIGAATILSKDGVAPQEIPAIKKRKRLVSGFADADAPDFDTLQHPHCGVCANSCSQLHYCLHCSFTGCWKDHILSHAVASSHTFLTDGEDLTVFCIKCNDYIYDADFERALNSEKFQTSNLITRMKDPSVKKPKFIEWHPTMEEAAKIKLFSNPIGWCTGLRGLRNMGSTCFMNVILQTFIHTPLLRTHFLSDRHNQNLCPLKLASKICIACEMDSLFTNFYSGQTSPYGPTSFLYSIWKCNAALAMYAQQDAHEFFMAVLNEIHSNCTTSTTPNTTCQCIIHEVFAGSLQSDVTCSKCNNITTTHDPILDLSLTIRQSKSGKSVKASAKKKAIPSSIPLLDSLKLKEDLCTLVECLERNFAAEKLTHYQCGNPECSKNDNVSILNSSESIKHVTIKTLPPVLAIQLKRFEHSGQGSKVETYVHIPLELDMTPYTARSVKSRARKTKKDPVASSSKKQSVRNLVAYDGITDLVPDHRYTLYAVVNHQGSLETGHYTAYVKTRDQWFMFDDHNIQLASQDAVLASKVYMCFYIRENLCMMPSPQLTVQSATPPVEQSALPT